MRNTWAIWLLVFLLVGGVSAIEWRDTLDQVNMNIDDTTDNGGMLRLYQIDTMKEVEQQRAMAEQTERLVTELSLIRIEMQQLNAKLDQQAAANTAIQAMFATTIRSNSTAFRELVDAVEALEALNP